MAEIEETEVHELAYSAEVVELYRSLSVFQTKMIEFVSGGKDAAEIKDRATALVVRLRELADGLDRPTASYSLDGDCPKGQIWDPVLLRCVDPGGGLRAALVKDSPPIE